MIGDSLMTLVLVGVRCVSCNPTPLDELNINLNLRDITEDEEKTRNEEFDVEQEMKAGQNTRTAAVVIGGYDGHGNLVERDEFFGNLGEWTRMSYPIKNKRSGMGVTSINKYVYMAGGQDKNSSSLDQFWQRNLTEQWFRLSNLQDARTFPTLSQTDIDIHGTPQLMLVVTGGRNRGGQPMKSTEIYNLETASWYYRRTMTKARFGHAAVNHDELLNVLGGDTKSTEFLDYIERKWIEGPPMNEERTHHAATVVNNLIYVCGGEKYLGAVIEVLRTCEIGNGKIFVPTTGMITPRSKFGMVTVDGKIWAIGGMNAEDGGKVLDSVEVYDPATEMWTEHPKRLKTPRFLFGGTTIQIDV